MERFDVVIDKDRKQCIDVFVGEPLVQPIPLFVNGRSNVYRSIVLCDPAIMKHRLLLGERSVYGHILVENIEENWRLLWEVDAMGTLGDIDLMAMEILYHRKLME